jgi:basic amino acid/polyamine antiporter, APA family
VPVTDAEGAQRRPTVQLRRELGLREAVAIGVGGTVGGGIFVLVGVAAGLAGPAALLAFLLAFAVAMVVALPYAELACRLPLAGGGYAFAREVLGPRWGFLMGWGYGGAYLFVSGFVTLGFGGYLEAVTGVPKVGGAVALVAACTVVNLLGVKLSGRAQAVVVLVAVGGLTALVAWGLPELRLDHLGPLAPHGAHGVLQAALVAFLSLGGFDMVAAAGEEVHQPERNLPRAILLTLLGVVGLYLLVTLVALGSLPSARLGASAAPLADAAGVFGGAAARRLIVGCALLTTAATANAVLVVTSRVVFAMARDRLLPGGLAAVGRSGGAPWAAVLACGAGLAVVAAAGSVRFATSAGGFLYVLHFVPPLLALVLLRRRAGGRPAAFATPVPRLLIPLALVASAVLVVAAGRTGLLAGGAWLLAGVVLLPSRRRLSAPAR